jgi:hypothetical protein
MTHPDKESPAIPDEVRTALDASSDRQLREMIHDAQARLEAHPPLTEEVTIQEGEEFVREDVEIDATIREALETGEDSQLREIVEYARQRLADRPPLTDVIEAREHEDLVRMKDEGAYTTVVVERPGETSEGRGPFAYMVQWEPHVGEDGKYKWHYIGRVFDEEGD